MKLKNIKIRYKIFIMELTFFVLAVIIIIAASFGLYKNITLTKTIYKNANELKEISEVQLEYAKMLFPVNEYLVTACCALLIPGVNL